MIQWHEVTWYSRWGAILLFLVVVPVLCFYIGTQYELTQQSLVQEPVLIANPSLKKNTDTQVIADLKGEWRSVTSTSGESLSYQFGTEGEYLQIDSYGVASGSRVDVDPVSLYSNSINLDDPEIIMHVALGGGQGYYVVKKINTHTITITSLATGDVSTFKKVTGQ